MVWYIPNLCLGGLITTGIILNMTPYVEEYFFTSKKKLQETMPERNRELRTILQNFDIDPNRITLYEDASKSELLSGGFKDKGFVIIPHNWILPPTVYIFFHLLLLISVFRRQWHPSLQKMTESSTLHMPSS